LFTEAALAEMALHPEAWHRAGEAYEHLGETPTASLDLHPRYEALIAERRAFLGAAESDGSVAGELPAPPPVVWEWLQDPRKLKRFSGIDATALARPGGRNGAGARNHCVHGKRAFFQTLLDVRPFDYLTDELAAPSGKPILRRTFQLTPTEKGTELRVSAQLLGTRLPRPARRELGT